MNDSGISKNIGDGWYFFIDVVGSSDPSLSISSQLEKITKIKDLILNFLLATKNPDIYKSFTGDGMLIVFSEYSYPMDLSIYIHKKLKEFNQNTDKPNLLSVRIGIGSGSYLSFKDGLHKEFAPWGHELVLSKRIMDLAKPNQILLTDFAFQKIKNDFLFDRNSYGLDLYNKGRVILKHHNELENVYSFYKEDEYGNNSDIEVNLDLKPLIVYYRFDSNFIDPFQKYCESRFEIMLHKFKEMVNPSKGLELGLTSVGLIYKVLFENAFDYISVTYFSPAEYWQIQNTDPLNLLSHHEKSLKRLRQSNVDTKKRYRFIIKEKEKLDKNILLNQNSSLLFIKWHAENNVNLFNFEPSDINSILNKYPKIVLNVGLGLWYEKYVLQFGPIMEYVNPKDQNHQLKRRMFWLHSVDSDTYIQCVKFFDELVRSTEVNNIDKIDHNYFNNVLNR